MVNIEDIREFCLLKNGVTEDFPFGPDVLVFRVGGKIFLLCDLSDVDLSINLKCDPQWAVELRNNYHFIKPGFHMNKKHWNTINIFEGADRKLLEEMINHSYLKVADGLPKNEKQKYLS